MGRERKILIVGSGMVGSGRTVISQLPKHTNLVDNDIVVIDGVSYQKIQEPKQKGFRGYNVYEELPKPYYGSNYIRQRPQVDIVEEFKLIKQKKSSLSKSDRDWVESQFKLKYKIIKNE